MVERFYVYTIGGARRDANGNYVTYEDYAKLQSRTAELETIASNLAKDCRKRGRRIVELQAQVDRARVLVDKWRKQNLNCRRNIEPAEAEGFDAGYDWREHNRSRNICADELEAAIK